MFLLLSMISSMMLSCVKSTSVRQIVHTRVPHDWVHNPPNNCGVGSSELSSVDADIEVAMEIAKEYAQIHLAERLSQLKFTTEIQGLLGASDEVLELEHTMLEEHTVLEEAAHVSFEHGVNTMFVLVCLED